MAKAGTPKPIVSEVILIEGEPPPPSRRGERWWEAAELCKTSSVEWVLVTRCAPGAAHAIRHGKYQAFREGNWHVEERPSDVEGRFDIYVKYLGGSDE